MKVMKFGGTSVGTPESILKVVNAIKNESSKKIVVLSASSGVTDMLISLANQLPESPIIARDKLSQISDKIEKIAEGLSMSEQSTALLRSMIDRIAEQIRATELLGITTQNISDKIVAMGEYLSTNLVYNLIKDDVNCAYLDIATHIVLDKKASEYKFHKKEAIVELLSKYDVIITQGFVCSDEKGHIINLGRGGSDFSASIIAAEMNAKELQIWTDVNGVMSADPRLIAKPITKRSINLANLERMAFFGAKVIHPDTLKPTLLNSIPVKILNTFDQENSGTIITNDRQDSTPTITIKKKCTNYTFHSSKKKNLYYLHSYMLRLIMKNAAQLLTTSHTDNTIQYTFEQELDLLLDENLKFEKKLVDLIYICELNNSKINIILKKINILKIERLEIDWHNGAILLLANTDNRDEEYNEFHDLLINIVE